MFFFVVKNRDQSVADQEIGREHRPKAARFHVVSFSTNFSIFLFFIFIFWCFHESPAEHWRDTTEALAAQQQQETESKHAPTPGSRRRTHDMRDTNMEHDFLVVLAFSPNVRSICFDRHIIRDRKESSATQKGRPQAAAAPPKGREESRHTLSEAGVVVPPVAACRVKTPVAHDGLGQESLSLSLLAFCRARAALYSACAHPNTNLPPHVNPKQKFPK